MFKIFLLIIALSGQPVGVSGYPPEPGTPDAVFATEAECQKHLPEAMQHTQEFLDKQTHGQLAVADAVCKIPPPDGRVI
jgi:hypothetical protein